MKRREFIRMIFGTTVAALLVRHPFRLIAASRSEEWEMPMEGRISFAAGDVYVNEVRVESGVLVGEGDTIRTGTGSEADVEIRDFAVFHLKEKSSVTTESILSQPKIRVKKGWFLLIVKRKNGFMVESPTALAGVRGTVIFFNVLDEKKTYFCDCNGKVTLSDPKTGNPVKNIVSQYHTAFQLNRGTERVEFERAKLLYHNDEDILKIADRFKRETLVFRKDRESKRY